MGLRSLRSHVASGIENPRFSAFRIDSGTSGSTAFFRRRFFLKPDLEVTRECEREFCDHWIQQRHPGFQRVRHARAVGSRKHVVDEENADIKIHDTRQVVRSLARGEPVGQEVEQSLRSAPLGKDDSSRSSKGVMVFQR